MLQGAVSAGGYKWTFAAPRPKLDASDVQELIDGIMPSRYNSGTRRRRGRKVRCYMTNIKVLRVSETSPRSRRRR